MSIMDIVRAKGEMEEMDATIPSCVEKMARDFMEFLDNAIKEQVNNRALLGAKVTAPSLNGDFRVVEVLSPEDGDEFPRLRCMAWEGGVREVTLSIRDAWFVGERFYAPSDGRPIPLGSIVVHGGEEVLVVGSNPDTEGLDVHRVVAAGDGVIGDAVERTSAAPAQLEFVERSREHTG